MARSRSRFGFLEPYLNGDVEIVREYGARRLVNIGYLIQRGGTRQSFFASVDRSHPSRYWRRYWICGSRVCSARSRLGPAHLSARKIGWRFAGIRSWPPGGAHSGGVGGVANNQQGAG
jgi:hypothetical protein